jgi:hypothetical protein
VTAPEYRRVKAGCLIVLAAVLTGAMTFMAVEVGLLAKHARIDADRLTGQYVGLVLPAQKALASVASASLTVAQVGAKERDAFSSQQAYYRNLTTHTDRLLGDADAAFKDFNTLVFPKVADALDAGTRTLNDSGDSVRKVAAASVDGLSGLRPVLDALESDATQARPAIQQFALASGHLNGTSANLEATSKDVADFAHRELAPARGVKNTIKKLLEWTANARLAFGL